MASVPPESTLARRMGFGALLAYGVGDMLGSGIYALIGKVAGVMGNAVWLAFVASMLAAMFTGLSYASLGSRYPRAAGAAYVAHKAFGKRFLTYLLGLTIVASGLTSLATQSRAFAGYFVGMLGADPSFAVVIALGFILVLTLVNYWGIRESLALNLLCTSVEAAGLVVVVLVGVRFWGSVDYFELPPPMTGTQSGFPVVLSGAVLTFYSFVGFEDIINVSEEVKNPRRNVPLAIVGALVLTALIYLAVSITVVSIIPYQELSRSNQPLVDAVVRAAPWFPAGAFSFIALFAITNTGLLNYIMGSRMIYGLARQGVVPRVLGRVHPVRRTPHLAILTLMVIVIALSLSGGVGDLASATSALLLCVFIVVNLALIVLQRRKDEAKGAFEVPSAVPALGVLTCATLLYHAQPKALLTALVLLIAISALYFTLKPGQVLADSAEPTSE